MLSPGPKQQSNSSSLLIFLAFPLCEVCFVMVWSFFVAKSLFPYLICTIYCTNTISRVIMPLNVCFAAGYFKRPDTSEGIAFC